MTAVTHLYGKDLRVKLSDGASTPAYIFIDGETSVSRKSSTDKIDLSDKSSGAYKISGSGQTEVTFSVSGKVKLPDAGLTRLNTLAFSGMPETNMQLVRSDIIVFQGDIAISNFSYTAATNGAVEFSADFTCVNAPTIDDITATA